MSLSCEHGLTPTPNYRSKAYREDAWLPTFKDPTITKLSINTVDVFRTPDNTAHVIMYQAFFTIDKVNYQLSSVFAYASQPDVNFYLTEFYSDFDIEGRQFYDLQDGYLLNLTGKESGAEAAYKTRKYEDSVYKDRNSISTQLKPYFESFVTYLSKDTHFARAIFKDIIRVLEIKHFPTYTVQDLEGVCHDHLPSVS